MAEAFVAPPHEHTGCHSFIRFESMKIFNGGKKASLEGASMLLAFSIHSLSACSWIHEAFALMTGNSNQNQSVIGRETIVDMAPIKLSPGFPYKSINAAEAALSEDGIESTPLTFCKTKRQKLVFRI